MKKKTIIVICAAVVAVILLCVLIFGRPTGGDLNSPADSVQTSDRTDAQVEAGTEEDDESIPSVVVEEDFEIVLEENEAVGGF